jgi:hypothetical protein
MRDQSVQTKAVVTVSEMARMVGLSRSRFYQLVEVGVFPQPVYSVANRRPIYVEESQRVCLEVRRRNCGVNGQPVLFYSRGHPLPTQTKPPRMAKPKPPKADNHADLIDGLAALGLTKTAAEVEAAIKSAYPTGVNGTDQGEVLRQVFLHLKRQNAGDKVGR